MNMQERYEAVVRSLDGNLAAGEADKVALLLAYIYPKDDSIAKIRESMREIGDLLKWTADHTECWDGSDKDAW